ncbi:glucoamylase family protein [Rubripirellula amarantea]|nr:glucoamylase family protein [Rubripirellula amarantea]
MTESDAAFLIDMQMRNYRFMVEAAHPETGFVSDRAASDGSWFSDHASSAACGFALTSHCVATEAGWIAREQGASHVRRLLDSLLNLAEHERGFLYHFFDRGSGMRRERSEASSIDTALLIAGSICAATTFADDDEITDLANKLYRRVEWSWMLGSNNLLHMGWLPETGMIPHQWDSYSELIILVLLAIGAPRHAIPGECWQAWRREPVLSYEGEGFLHYPPLFVHQYPMAYFDFRAVRSPSGRSYWDNAVRAHKAQIAFLRELGVRYPTQLSHYGDDLWGLTSSDSIDGYRDWGGPYQAGRFEPDRGIDGSIVPSAAAGGLAIVPEQALHTLREQQSRFGERVYGRYGFINVYNPVNNWVGRDVIGIDTGISLIMAENLRSGGVWNAFMKHEAPQRALELAGFTKAS